MSCQARKRRGDELEGRRRRMLAGWKLGRGESRLHLSLFNQGEQPVFRDTVHPGLLWEHTAARQIWLTTFQTQGQFPPNAGSKPLLTASSLYFCVLLFVVVVVLVILAVVLDV